MRSRYLQGGGIHAFWSLVLYFCFFFKRALTIIERVKIKFSPTANKHPQHSNKKHSTFSALSSQLSIQPLFKQNMKLSTILFPLALVLGLASATRREKDASLKTALRGRLEDASRSQQKASNLSTPYRHPTIDTFDPMYCTVLWSSS